MTKDDYLIHGCELLNEFVDANTDIKMINQVLKTLHTVINNINGEPFEPKFRKLGLDKKVVKDKFLPHKSIMSFLNMVGFVKTETHIEMEGHNGESLRMALESILNVLQAKSEKLGVVVNSGFDPTAE